MYRIFAIFLFVQTIPEAFTMPTYLDQNQSAEVREAYFSKVNIYMTYVWVLRTILYNFAEMFFLLVCKK